MNGIDILKDLGILGIITGGVVWLIKQLTKSFLDRDLKNYESQLQHKTDSYMLELNKNLESFKTQLSILNLKAGRIHEKRLGILEELYKRIIELNQSMEELTGNYWLNTSEEESQLRTVKGKYENFITYYSIQKIYFSEDLCSKIEALRQKYSLGIVNFESSMLASEIDENASNYHAEMAVNAVEEKIPPILQTIENEFRELLGI